MRGGRANVPCFLEDELKETTPNRNGDTQAGDYSKGKGEGKWAGMGWAWP